MSEVSNDDTIVTPISAEDIERLSKLFTVAGELSCARIGEMAGAEFLNELLADESGEIVVTVALKGARARIQVSWPKFHESMQTVCDLQAHRNHGRAQ
jgi:hypothetical protein